MPNTPWPSTVSKISNGQDVSAETLNPILAQHTQRELHLFEKFDEVRDKSVLIAFSQPVLPQDPVVVKKYSVVFYDKVGSDEGVSPAKVDFVVNPERTTFSASNSAYSIGLVRSLNEDNSLADVYLVGLVDLDVDIDDPTFGLFQSNEIDLDADFIPGPLFLSRSEAGKVTRKPGGIAIYVGYAFNRRSIYIAPNVNEFNQFFTTYRFTVLDRPAGKPSYTTTTWTVVDSDLDKVGWVSVDALPLAISAFAPDGAKFFYNLPSDTKITADTGIPLADRVEQKELAAALPPNPPTLTMFVVNGIVQDERNDNNPLGSYVLNELGIWWFLDQTDEQPWASDIPVREAVTRASDEIYLADHGFSLGDVVQFTNVGGGLPAPLVAGTNYYVVTLNVDDDHFKVSTQVDGAVLPLTTAGTGTHYIYQPYIWKTFRGSEILRPRMSLQFIKLNPTIKDAVVTSLKRYNTGSDALSFYKSDKSAAGTTGDLLARLLLTFEADAAATSSATAIKSLSYDEETGVIKHVDTPVISKLIEGDGITLTQQVVSGVTQPGSLIISSTTKTTSGVVSSLEPDGAELLFNGLHSYLNMTLPATLPSSIIGKITLPAGIPASDMTFVILMIGAGNVSGTKTVEFEFTYAVSKVGTVVDTTVSTPVTVSFDMPTTYTAKTVFKVGNATDAITAATLKIPASAFTGGDASVNFKLARTLPGATPYTYSIGIVDIYWKLG